MESVGLREANVESPGLVARRARKSMSGAANNSTTKFPISCKVPLEWLTHRLASPNPAMPSGWGVFVTPGRPTTRGFGLVDARSRWLCATCLDNVTPILAVPAWQQFNWGVFACFSDILSCLAVVVCPRSLFPPLLDRIFRSCGLWTGGCGCCY
ncbi:hypothetical protein V6N13_116708 [Hibiscus sabdariffa]